jgi:3-oxoacyl-(acyl-carrier-protein) synthase
MLPLNVVPTGIVPTEGSAAFVLEELEHAWHREAPIYCEITGFGASALNNKKGMVRSFQKALKGESVDIVYSDAKSTEDDVQELAAIDELDGDVAITNVKGQLGHAIHAGSAVQLACALESMD